MFTALFFYNSQDLEACQVPIGIWVVKKNMVHLNNGILLDHKKKEVLLFAIAWSWRALYQVK